MSLSKTTLRSLLRQFDRDIFQVSALDYTVAIMRKQRVFAEEGIDLVIDVGANEGQFGSFLREKVGYKGRIVSFEPLSAAYRSLANRAAADAQWEVRNVALGSQVGTAKIHVAGNSQSSSLLNMLSAHTDSAPASVYVSTEDIQVSTLDIETSFLALAKQRTYLKIDTQGFERAVIDGGSNAMQYVNILELEMSFVPLYEGQALFHEMVELLRDTGFVMVSIEPNFCNAKTGEILQADVVLKRKKMPD